MIDKSKQATATGRSRRRRSGCASSGGSGGMETMETGGSGSNTNGGGTGGATMPARDAFGIRMLYPTRNSSDRGGWKAMTAALHTCHNRECPTCVF